jgi:hypothetical protein
MDSVEEKRRLAGQWLTAEGAYETIEVDDAGMVWVVWDDHCASSAEANMQQKVFLVQRGIEFRAEWFEQEGLIQALHWSDSDVWSRVDNSRPAWARKRPTASTEGRGGSFVYAGMLRRILKKPWMQGVYPMPHARGARCERCARCEQENLFAPEEETASDLEVDLSPEEEHCCTSCYAPL